MFLAPAEKFAVMWADRGAPVYFYRFEQVGYDLQGNQIQFPGWHLDLRNWLNIAESLIFVC